jgi:hypothetical protein
VPKKSIEEQQLGEAKKKKNVLHILSINYCHVGIPMKKKMNITAHNSRPD